MNVIPFNDDRETALILTTDLLARVAQGPMTRANLERVNNLAKKVMTLSEPK